MTLTHMTEKMLNTHFNAYIKISTNDRAMVESENYGKYYKK